MFKKYKDPEERKIDKTPIDNYFRIAKMGSIQISTTHTVSIRS